MQHVPVVAREREVSERLSESDRDRAGERRDKDWGGGDHAYASPWRRSPDRRSDHKDMGMGMVRERDHSRDRVSNRDKRRESDRDQDCHRYDSDRRDRRRVEEERDRRERSTR